MMERPTIDPTTGEPRWRPNGARQRFAQRMVEEVDPLRVFVAQARLRTERVFRLIMHECERNGAIR